MFFTNQATPSELKGVGWSKGVEGCELASLGAIEDEERWVGTLCPLCLGRLTTAQSFKLGQVMFMN